MSRLHAPMPSGEALLARWVEAFNVGHLEALVALYARDAVLLGTSGPEPYVGREQIRGYFRGGATVRIERMITRCPQPETLLCTGLYAFSRKADGEETLLPARFTFVFTAEDGEFRILHHHSSALPAPR